MNKLFMILTWALFWPKPRISSSFNTSSTELNITMKMKMEIAMRAIFVCFGEILETGWNHRRPALGVKSLHGSPLLIRLSIRVQLRWAGNHYHYEDKLNLKSHFWSPSLTGWPENM